MAPDPAPAPLDGVRVLDFTQYFSGPVCTRMLAELGADVIKVELPPYGDPQRGSSPRANKRSGTYLSQNRGKRSLCLDYRSDHGRRVVGALLPHVDVVVENFAPGVMARRGLGYDEMQAINPRLILASITGFGQTGTWSHRPAFDAVIQAYSGVMHMTGEPDGAPNLAGLPVADTSAGIHAFGAIGFALYSRTITGRGTHIDIAMVDSLFHQHEIPIHARSLDPTYEAERAGRHHTTQCPAGSFRSPQGWVAIFCTNDQIDRLWDAMGRPDLAADDRFRLPTSRLEHRDEITVAIETWMATFTTDADVLATLHTHRVPAAPVVDPSRAAEHDYYVERGAVVLIDDPLVGPVHVPGPPIRYSNMPTGVTFETRPLGHDNRDVLTHVGGMTDDEIAALAAAGTIVTRSP